MVILDEYDDIDDYHDTNLSLIGVTTDITKGEVIDKDLNFFTTVTYASDTATITDDNSTLTVNNIFMNKKINSDKESNIKFITVEITSKSGEDILKKNIKLYSFSSNIGTYAPEGEMNIGF